MASFPVRLPDNADSEVALHILADAFEDNPQFVDALHDGEERERMHPLLLATCVRYGLTYGKVWGTEPESTMFAGVTS